MLQDYEIINSNSTGKLAGRTDRIMAVVEFILVLFLIQSALMLFTGQAAEKDESFRFRILAHSDAARDQQLKKAIQLEIEPLIHNAVEQAGSKREIEDNLKAIEGTILGIAKSKAGGLDVSLERKAALFPPKRSGLFITPQAPYDAYILTIGSGRGDNWWCSLFPRVCFPEAEAEKVDNAETVDNEKVTFFIWEWIKSLFN